MTDNPRPVVGVLLRVHRLCLFLYPRRFRESHGAAMAVTFEDVLTAGYRRGGWRGAWRVALAELWALVLQGLRERFRPKPGQAPRLPRSIHDLTPRERPRMHVSSNFRYVVRSLARTPGYTAAFVLTLGLGIGANTAIFSVINGVLLRPLPYPEADRILYLQQVATKGGTGNSRLSFVEVADYRTQATTLDQVVEFGDWTFNVLGRGDPHLATAGLVTANFFEVLGMRPMLGRTFTEEDDSRASDPVAVLTYEYWVNVFGADSSVIGQALDLTAKKATIVGVLEPGSHYASMRGLRQDFYANYPSNDHYMSAAMQDERSHRMTDVFARLAPGATVQEARVEIGQIAARLHATYPDAYPEQRGYQTVVTPWRDQITQDARPMLLILFGTAVFVLVIACANVANLTLTKLIRRERELAVRAALGAGLARLRGQLLAENLLLSLAGAGLGLVLAVTGLDLLVAYTARFTPRTGEISVDLFVLLFTLGVAVGAAMLFAWAPRLPLSQDLGASLTAAGGGRATGAVSRRRAQRALVVSQLAISFMLLVGAGLLVRSLVQLSHVNPGFDLENVLTMGVPEFSQRTQPQREKFHRTLVDRVGGDSRVHSAAMASGAPLLGAYVTPMRFKVEGREVPSPDVAPLTLGETVSAGYFETIGTPLLAGRTFSSSDTREAPLVAVINESMATFYFPEQDPIGRRMARERYDGSWTEWFTIIGVVADTKAAGLDRDPVHAWYEVSTQGYSPSTLLVRTEGDSRPVAGRVIEEVRALDPNQPVARVHTLGDLRAEDMAPHRLNATLFTIFALLALAIATVGIAGVLSFSVSQRTNEFGIRMTLGADQRRVLQMVLREGATLAVVALGLGGAGALVLSRFLSGLLFEVQPTDPATFFGVATLLALVALGASYLPARSATSVDPMTALRAD